MLLFAKVSYGFGLPPGLLSAVCFTESSHNVSVIHHHDGRGDSIGVCQLKLATARVMGFQGDARTLQLPEVNIYYAGKYLSHQLHRYYRDIGSAVAAYNSGTLRVDARGEIRNKNYVRKVFTALKEGR